MTATTAAPEVSCILVITLRNGVQIRQGVKSFETTRSASTNRLTAINWVLDEDPAGSSINWIDFSEVVAVHAERELQR